MDRERVITIAIVIGIFGGLIGGPILSLADYYAPPERRFWLPIPYGNLRQIKKEEAKISAK